MKKGSVIMLIFLIILPCVLSQEIKIDGLVNDYADIISPEKEKEIESELRKIYDSGNAEYSIVTVNSLEGKDIESYSWDIAEGNLGDAEKNNGLLLLVSLEEKEYRFEVGRGIEYILNDAKVGRIGRNYLVPDFKKEQYGEGILKASKAVSSILLEDVESEYYVSDEEEYSAFHLILTLLIIFWTIGMPVLAIILRNRGFKNRYFDAAAGAIILFGGRGKGGTGGFGGFGGGGFGGFGGGGFGGGGASGGW